MSRHQLSRANDEQVRLAVREAIDARDSGMGAVEFAIAKALSAGRLLRAKKGELQHGEFQQWIEDSDFGVGYDTCRRWMKLAERAELHGEQIENAQSVRQAYMLTGLLPEPEATGDGSGSTAGNSFLTFLTRSTTHLQATLSQHPLAHWSLDDRRTLRARLEPLVKIYQSLLDASKQ